MEALPTPMPRDIAFRFFEDARKDKKRLFMQAAVLEMLANQSDILPTQRTPKAIAAKAEEMYDAIEELLK